MNGDEPMPHEQARELLPWLVNDSLAAEERRGVKNHAQSCVVCRRELTELERLRESITLTAESAASPAPDMRRVNARIDALIESGRRGERLLQALGEFVRRPLRVAFAAQTALLLVLLAVLLRPEPVEFTTLTTPVELPAGDYIRVVFDPDLGAAGVEAVLDRSGLEVVAGPSARGVATLRFELRPDSDRRDLVLRRLLDHPGVLFATHVADPGQ